MDLTFRQTVKITHLIIDHPGRTGFLRAVEWLRDETRHEHSLADQARAVRAVIAALNEED